MRASGADDLLRLNVTKAGLLLLKRGEALGGWVGKAEAIGRDNARSSANLYDRLEHLRTLTGLRACGSLLLNRDTLTSYLVSG